MKKTYNKNPKLLIISLIILNVLFLGLIIWLTYSHYQRVSFESDGNNVVMIVKYSGGLCANNQICQSSNKIYSNGTYQGNKSLTKNEVATLSNYINTTDFNNFDKNPSPKCQSFVDGSDLVLEFPQKYPNKSFTPCMLSIPKDNPTMLYINNLISTHQVSK